MKQTINGWTKSSMIQHIKDNFKGKSVSDFNGDTCLYRGPNDTKCAVGMFIPDNLYKPEMDQSSATDINGGGVSYSKLVTIYPEISPFMPLEPTDMTALQAAHDSSHSNDTLDEMIHWIDTHVE